ncbi:MAG: CRISPR-associated endonuclease Cas1 [Ideonella sp. MAG2]|nr:MAG: CRISPR-associated endonuclease Cas1 [Ideonella sp. MAG2]
MLEAQFQRAQEPEFALAVARRLIATKLRNTATVLARTLRRHPTQQPEHHDAAHQAPARLREWADAAERAPDLTSLRGTEGASAALYFQTLGRLLAPAWGFSTRQARPAPDPVNALLSFGYSVLYQAVAGLLRARGLHAHLGLFHASGGAHMALASDLMEPYRAYAVDAPVLRLLFAGEGGIQPDDGARDGPAWRLGAATQRALIHAIETRFNTPMQHPQSQEPMDLRRLIDADIRTLSQALRAGQVGDFWPAYWR